MKTRLITSFMLHYISVISRPLQVLENARVGLANPGIFVGSARPASTDCLDAHIPARRTLPVGRRDPSKTVQYTSRRITLRQSVRSLAHGVYDLAVAHAPRSPADQSPPSRPHSTHP